MAERCPNHGQKNAVKRGLCTTCYDMLAKRVQRGLTSWAALEAEGVVMPQAKRGRKLNPLKPV